MDGSRRQFLGHGQPHSALSAGSPVALIHDLLDEMNTQTARPYIGQGSALDAGRVDGSPAVGNADGNGCWVVLGGNFDIDRFACDTLIAVADHIGERFVDRECQQSRIVLAESDADGRALDH